MLRLSVRAGRETAIRERTGVDDWCIQLSWRERILASGKVDWFGLDGDPAAYCVKKGRNRSAWRVMVEGADLFAKVFNAGGGLERVKAWFAGEPAEREWRAASVARMRGVSVPECLGVGIRGGKNRRSVFLSQWLDQARPLSEVWRTDIAKCSHSRRYAASCRTIDAVARLVARAHDEGFVHRDGHAQNIVVGAGSIAALNTAYIDVHAARITRRPASFRAVVRSLAQIDQHFRHYATRTERLRFLRCYLSHRAKNRVSQSPGGTHMRTLVIAVTREVDRHALRLARQRDRRLLRNGKYFATLRLGGGWRAKVVLELERRHAFPEGGVPDRTCSQWREVLSPLLNIQVTQRVPYPDGVHGHMEAHNLTANETRAAGLGARLAWSVFGSPSRREFDACHRLRHRGLPSKLILGYVEHRSFGLVDLALVVRPREADSYAESRVLQWTVGDAVLDRQLGNHKNE